MALLNKSPYISINAVDCSTIDLSKGTKTMKSKKKKRILKICLCILMLLITVFVCIVAVMYFSSKFSVMKLNATASTQDNLVLVNWENPITSIPEDLVYVAEVINGDTVTFEDAGHMIDRTAGLAANRMFEAAKQEGVGKFIINNAYRSVETQTVIWQNRIDQDPAYGSDPYNNPVKAMPGDKSEHSTGLALDILCENHNSADDAFGETVEGNWLAENAHNYGFILRYPANKEHITGVIYEPWHFRYVGVEAATEIYERGMCLEEYLNEKN